MRPIIGITCNYDFEDTVGKASSRGAPGQDWDFVAGDYVYAVEKAGGTPVLLPQCKCFDTLLPLLDALDGLLLSGGNDVDPLQYGQLPTARCGEVVPMRDEQDTAVARYVLHRTDKPVLGICRGMQVMNVACGGTLHQDLQESGFSNHAGLMYPRNVAWHSVEIEKSSRLFDALGTASIRVNSYHHQGVDAPGEALRVVARASHDQVAEAVELDGGRFRLGVQWHPEMMFDSEEQHRLLSAFVAACKR